MGMRFMENNFSIVQILTSAFLDSIGRENCDGQIAQFDMEFDLTYSNKKHIYNASSLQREKIKRKYKNRNIIQKPDIQQQEKGT